MRTTVLRLMATLVTCTVAASSALAQEHGRDSMALAQRVDSVFSDYDRSDSPGCAMGVIQDGDLIYARGYGMANLDLGTAITPASVFRIGSTSKQFTAAAVVLAAQRGELSLDDDIRRYLPELPDYGTGITIRHLLHHTSGIRDYLELMYLAGLRDDDWYTDDEVVAMLARQKATNFEPGSEHLYSNSGYFLISQIIERATGMTLREYAHENIFRPLGMTHTHFHDDHTEIVANRASGYGPSADGGFRISMTNLDMVGDGGVFTTVEDLLLWDRNFYEPRVGGEELLRAMHTRGILTTGDTLDYALGLRHAMYRGLPTVRHGGAFVGYRADMIRFPEQRLSVVCLCNLATTNPTALAERVADIYLEELLEPRKEGAAATGPSLEVEPIPLSRSQLAAREGLYRRLDGDNYLRVALQDDALVLLIDQAYELVPLAADRFRLRGLPVEIRFTTVASGARMTVIQGGAERHYEMVEAAAYDEAELAKFTGAYYSEELDATYVIRMEDGKLEVLRGRGDPVPLVSTIVDEFTLEGARVRFERNGGRPSGFVLDAGRVRGIRFKALDVR